MEATKAKAKRVYTPFIRPLIFSYNKIARLTTYHTAKQKGTVA
jgi:hypothetical protein